MVSALGRMRRPTATTRSAASTRASAPKPAVRALCWAVIALRSARRCASLRGNSPFSGVSSTWAGTRCSGSMPIWFSSASRRGEAEARISSGRPAIGLRSLETVGDATLGEVVGGHFAQDLVAGENANAVLAHAPGGVGDDFMVVFQLHAEGRIGKQFGDHARKFEHFFLGHTFS